MGVLIKNLLIDFGLKVKNINLLNGKCLFIDISFGTWSKIRLNWQTCFYQRLESQTCVYLDFADKYVS